MAVFNCNSAISPLKESVGKTCWLSVLKTLGIPEEDRSNGMKPRWPDQKNEWSICRGELWYARRILDLERSEICAELSDKALSMNGVSKAEAMEKSLLDANMQPRDKSIVVLPTHIEAGLNEGWGRRPKA